MKVLIVDDIAMNRDILSDVLDDTFDIIEADNGTAALRILDEKIEEINVMLLDLNMPGISGLEVLRRMNAARMLEKLPVLVITGDDDSETERLCLEQGVTDFIRKPFNVAIVKLRTVNAARLYSMKHDLEVQVAEKTSELRLQNSRLHEKNEGIIDLLGTLVDARDRESGEHIFRVKEFSRIIAEDIRINNPEYKLSEDDVQMITIASVLHDVGKIMVPDSILLKPGTLTKREYSKMKYHTIYGCDIIKRASHLWDDEYNFYSDQICHYHHERYDGKGYPEGLKGDDIPISAQIVALADVFDAFITKRVYKDAIPPDEAFFRIMNSEAGVFNPKILASFERCYPKMKEICSIKINDRF